MANLHALVADASDAGTFSAGDWETSLPLTNLKTQQPKQVARTVDTDPSSTRFVVNLGRLLPISMFALINNNLSALAMVRIRVSQNADGSSPVIDVTIPAFEGNVPFGSMPWGVLPWDGFLQDVQPGGPITFYKHSTSEFGQYILIDIEDEDNPDGYVQAGRFLAGDAFVSKINMAYGVALSFIDESRQSRSVGLQLYSDKKPLRRKLSAQFNWLSEAEAIGAIYDIQRAIGLTGNLLVVYDPEDTNEVLLRRTIYGTLTELSPLVTSNETPDYPYSTGISVEELI